MMSNHPECVVVIHQRLRFAGTSRCFLDLVKPVKTDDALFHIDYYLKIESSDGALSITLSFYRAKYRTCFYTKRYG